MGGEDEVEADEDEGGRLEFVADCVVVVAVINAGKISLRYNGCPARSSSRNRQRPRHGYGCAAYARSRTAVMCAFCCSPGGMPEYSASRAEMPAGTEGRVAWYSVTPPVVLPPVVVGVGGGVFVFIVVGLVVQVAGLVGCRDFWAGQNTSWVEWLEVGGGWMDEWMIDVEAKQPTVMTFVLLQSPERSIE